MAPEGFLNLAENLVKVSAPAFIRSSISRSYYAFFLTARNWLKCQGIEPKEPTDHKVVAECLQAAATDELRKCGRMLWDMRRLRNQADYDLDDTETERQSLAKTQLAIAQAQMRLVRNLPVTPQTTADLWQRIAQTPSVSRVEFKS